MNGNNEARDKIGFNPAARHSANQSQHGRGLPEPPVCPVPPSLCVSELPVSAGHGPEMVLKTLAAKNACTGRNSARKRLWKLVRDLRAIEEGIGRGLEIANLMVAFNEWHQRSQPFLDPAKTLEHYLAEFLAGFRKVRVPTGKGDTINKALEAVSDRSADELPVIPGIPDAPESYRRLAALHHEI
jgi:hypothetical protein